MNAHDRLERQLREAVSAAAATRRRRLDTRGAVLAVTAVVTLAVVVIVVISLGSGSGLRPRTDRSTGRGTSTAPSRTSPTLSTVGPVPRGVDDTAVNAAFTTTWSRDPACSPERPPSSPAASESRGMPPEAILAAVPALSRLPMTPADQPFGPTSHAGVQIVDPDGGSVYVDDIRLARVVNGLSYYLVPESGLGRAPVTPSVANRCFRLETAALSAQLSTVAAAERAATRRYGEAQFSAERQMLERQHVHDGVALVSERRSGGLTLDSSESQTRLATLAASGLLEYTGSGHGGVRRIDGVVPAGVARVTLQFSSTDVRANYVVRVVNDVFVFAVPTGVRHQRLTSMLWLDASGRVIKSVDERSSGA